jgi:hypothetical protein
MKSLNTKCVVASLIVPLTIGMLITARNADAWGRYGGGSFRGGDDTYEDARGGEVTSGRYGGAEATGPNGGEAVRTPYGGAAAVSPDGSAAAVRTPYGGTAVAGPDGNAAAVRTPYGDATIADPNADDAAVVRGPDGATAVRGPHGIVVVGYRTAVLPPSAVAVDIDGTTYYQDGQVMYEQVYEGSDVVYIVVTAPTN